MCGIDYNRFPDAFDELPCDYARALGALLRWEDAPRKVLRYLESPEGIRAFEMLKHTVTWGPAVGWRARTSYRDDREPTIVWVGPNKRIDLNDFDVAVGWSGRCHK